MKIIKTGIPDLVIIEPRVGNARAAGGDVWTTGGFSKAKLDLAYVQDNHRGLQKGILRGLHFQKPKQHGKLASVTRGAVFHVAVDLRWSSPYFGKWVGTELSAHNQRMLWAPEGFANGFLSLADGTDVLYQCTAPYSPENEHILFWNDPAVAIDWPVDGWDPIISEKDASGHSLSQVPVFA